MTRWIAALFVLLAGCEGTWATPMQIEIKPQGGSHIAGIASARVALESIHGTGAVGSDVDAQFESLHDPRPYELIVQRGACNQTGSVVARLYLEAYPNRNEGLHGSGHVGVPVHQLMKDGYSIALLDRGRRAVVACGDLQTDRPF